jgi:SsrA-binding protein
MRFMGESASEPRGDRAAGDDRMPIVQNRKALHDYFIEERHEAGLVLEGWEVKAVRAGRAQIADAYVIVKDSALWLVGAHVSPLATASTHVSPDPLRTRKLLMHADEIRRLAGKVERRGYALVPLDLHFSKGRVKAQIALAKGKLRHDKRAAEREREWRREKQRLLRTR